MPPVTSGGAGYISWNPNHGAKKPEPVINTQTLNTSMEHYTKLREKLEQIKTINDLPPLDANFVLMNEVINIASEALTAVFFYMGAAFGAEKQEAKEPPKGKVMSWKPTNEENIKTCQAFVVSHTLHRDFKTKATQDSQVKLANYAHILEVARKATEMASELQAASNPYNVDDLADELSADSDFIKSFRNTHEMRLQRVYDAIAWVQWWSWWKDGVQYVGTTGKTMPEAKEEICKQFEVTVTELDEAYGRLQYSGPYPF